MQMTGNSVNLPETGGAGGAIFHNSSVETKKEEETCAYVQDDVVFWPHQPHLLVLNEAQGYFTDHTACALFHISTSTERLRLNPMKQYFSDVVFGSIEHGNGFQIEALPDRLTFDWRSWFRKKRLEIPWSELSIVPATTVGLNHPNYDRFGIALKWTPSDPNHHPTSIYLQCPPSSPFHAEIERLITKTKSGA